MKIKRTFNEKGVSLETLINLVLTKNLDEIIDNEIFNSNEEGN